MKEKVIELLSKAVPINKEELTNLIETPPSSELGDYAFPCFTLSKQLKKSPQEIAEETTQQIIKNLISSKPSFFEKVEAKGPYVNFYINRNLIASETLKKILKEKGKFGSQKDQQKTIIEFPGPNTNKPLHLGHIRNIVLGQAVVELMKFSGNRVSIVNINNDRGIHICKSMLAYEKFGNDDNPKKSCKKPDHFVGDYYVKFTIEAEKDKELEGEAKEMLKKWEQDDKEVKDLWKKMNSWAFKGFEETYKKFNLKIDKHYYESDIYKSGKELIQEQYKKGVVSKKDDGAFFIDLNDKGLGEKILIRSDGTSIYITQDIYLAVLRQKEFKFDKAIYVVAREQDYHFQVLFELLKRFEYKWADKLYHLSYGMVNLESGRMKSREGTVVDADDLIEGMKNLALEEIEKRWPELSKKEKEKRALAIAMSAIRYYFLRVDRLKDVTFKPEESLSFEGNTGPYLLYTYARAKSILRKAKKKPSAKLKIPQLDEKEKALIIKLYEFPEKVKEAYSSLAPNLIANYSFELAQMFNEFYHSNQVIGSQQEQFRLSVVAACAQVLKNGLALLDIETLEKM